MFCTICWHFGWNVWWACWKTLSCLQKGLHMVSIGTHIEGGGVLPILILQISLNNAELCMFKINIVLALPKTQTLRSIHVPVYIPPYILSSIHFEQGKQDCTAVEKWWRGTDVLSIWNSTIPPKNSPQLEIVALVQMEKCNSTFCSANMSNS